MKYLLPFVLLLICSIGGAQSTEDHRTQPPAIVEQLAKAKKKFGDPRAPMSPFSPVAVMEQSARRHASTVPGAQFFTLRKKEMSDILGRRPKTLQLSLRVNDTLSVVLDLFEKNPFARDIVIRTSEGETVKPGKGVHYRGIARDIPGSVAGISFFADEVIGMLSIPGIGQLSIGRIEGEEELHTIYAADKLPEDFTYSCGTPDTDTPTERAPDASRGSRDLSDCVRIYVETDFALFQNRGSIQGVETWVAGVFNNISIIYTNESINTEVSEIFIWTTMDGYSRTNAGQALNKFRQDRGGSYNGNIAHLCALGGNGLGGLAYVNVLCDPFWSFAYSNVNAGYNNFPNYSWTIMVIAHEIGHNLGSQHTQWCGWPGGAIDNCYEPEGSCSPGPPPTNGGTVMSYCHLTSHGINLQNGFGTLPGNRIRNRVDAASCLEPCTDPCGDFAADILVEATSCGFQNGTINITVNGGRPPYTIDIGNGPSQNTQYENLPAGFYSITITDNIDCQLYYVVEVESSSRPSVFVYGAPTTCDEANGYLEVNASGGVQPYTFDIGFGPTTNQIFTDLEAGLYQITVTDINGCLDVTSYLIQASEALVAGYNIEHTTCGNDNGRIEIIASGGTMPYLYSIGGDFTTESAFTHLEAGEYEITVTDPNDCIATLTAIVQPSTGIIASGTATPTTCGQHNGSITITASTDYPPLVYELNGQSQNSNVFNNLAGGTYIVRVSDDSDCTKEITVTVSPSSAVQATTTVEPAFCGNDSGSITVQATSGKAPFQYNFGQGFQNAPDTTGLAPGAYTVTVRDSSGCTLQLSVTVPGSTAITFSAETTEALCGENNGSITITANGGNGDYEYNIGNGWVTGNTFTGLAAGSYQVSVRDSDGCIRTETIQVPSSGSFSASYTSTATTCGLPNGSITLQVTGGKPPYSYLVAGRTQTDPVFEDLAGGDYLAVITDSDGCTLQLQIHVGLSQGIQIELQITHTSCGLPNGSITAHTPGGQGEHIYDIGAGPQLSPLFTQLAPGDYTVTVTDENGCTGSESFTILPSEDMDIALTITHTTCEEDEGSIVVAVDGGSGPITFDIGRGPQSGNRFDNLPAGDYTVTVTDHAGCVRSSEATIRNEGDLPRAAFSAIDNGRTVLFVSRASGDPHTYEWTFGDGGASNDRNPVYTYANLGSYNVCLTVSNDCGTDTHCDTVAVITDRNCTSYDSTALVALYNATNGPHWTITWNLERPVDEWYGLGFTAEGCLLTINLQANNLVGTLPDELGDLITVQSIDLSYNHLRGALPAALGNLAGLYELQLAGNTLSDTLPPAIEGMANLGILDLSENAFAGSLPAELGNLNNLISLNLVSNRFTGEIPQNIDKLTQLRFLGLSRNQLTGQIPSTVYKLTQLQRLYVNHNRLSGRVPEGLAELDSLKAVWLNNNEFTDMPMLRLTLPWSDDAIGGLRVEQNRLTFTDVLPNMPVFSSLAPSEYAPQAKVYRDTVFNLLPGGSLTVDIDVDRSLSGVVYTWFMNGQWLRETSVPELTIIDASAADHGVYYCEIRHPDAPRLVLLSHQITIEVIGTATSDPSVSNKLRAAPNPVSSGGNVYLWSEDGILQSPVSYSWISAQGLKVTATGYLHWNTANERIEVPAPQVPGMYLLRYEEPNKAPGYIRIIVY